MMDEFEKEQARLSVLEQLLANRQVKKTEQDDLVKSYQLATAGRNNRDFFSAFSEAFGGLPRIVAASARCGLLGRPRPHLADR